MSVSLEFKDCLLLHMHRSAVLDSEMAQWKHTEHVSVLDFSSSHTFFYFFVVCLCLHNKKKSCDLHIDKRTYGTLS